VDTHLATNFFKTTGSTSVPLLASAVHAFVDKVMPVMLRTPASSAASMLHAATAPSSEVAGRYLFHTRASSPDEVGGSVAAGRGTARGRVLLLGRLVLGPAAGWGTARPPRQASTCGCPVAVLVAAVCGARALTSRVPLLLQFAEKPAHAQELWELATRLTGATIHESMR
jgi:hypothetical protein